MEVQEPNFVNTVISIQSYSPQEASNKDAF